MGDDKTDDVGEPRGTTSADEGTTPESTVVDPSTQEEGANVDEGGGINADNGGQEGSQERKWTAVDWIASADQLRTLAIRVAFWLLIALAFTTVPMMYQEFPAAALFSTITALTAATLVVAFASSSSNAVVRTIGLVVVASLIIPVPELSVLISQINGEDAEFRTEQHASRRANSHNREAAQAIAMALTDRGMISLNHQRQVNLTELANTVSCMLDSVELSKVSKEVDARGATLILQAIYENRAEQLFFGIENDARIAQDFDFLRERYLLDYPYSSYRSARLTQEGCELVRQIYEDMYNQNETCVDWIRRLESAGNRPIHPDDLYETSTEPRVHSPTQATQSIRDNRPASSPALSLSGRPAARPADQSKPDIGSRSGRTEYAFDACYPDSITRSRILSPAERYNPPFEAAPTTEDTIYLSFAATAADETAFSPVTITREIELAPHQLIGKWLSLEIILPGYSDALDPTLGGLLDHDWMLVTELRSTADGRTDPAFVLFDPRTRELVDSDDDGGIAFDENGQVIERTFLDSRSILTLQGNRTLLLGLRDLRRSAGPLSLTLTLIPQSRTTFGPISEAEIAE